MAAEDVRGLVKAHLAQQGQRPVHVEHGEAVVLRHGMGEDRAFQFQHLRKGNLLGRQQGRVVAKGCKVRAGIAGVARHRGEDVALVVAVQAGHFLRPEQRKRLPRTRPQVDLVAQREDPVRVVLFDGLHHGFKRQNVAVDIGDQCDAHGLPPVQ